MVIRLIGNANMKIQRLEGDEPPFKRPAKTGSKTPMKLISQMPAYGLYDRHRRMLKIMAMTLRALKPPVNQKSGVVKLPIKLPGKPK